MIACANLPSLASILHVMQSPTDAKNPAAPAETDLARPTTLTDTGGVVTQMPQTSRGLASNALKAPVRESLRYGLERTTSGIT